MVMLITATALHSEAFSSRPLQSFLQRSRLHAATIPMEAYLNEDPTSASRNSLSTTTDALLEEGLRRGAREFSDLALNKRTTTAETVRMKIPPSTPQRLDATTIWKNKYQRTALELERLRAVRELDAQLTAKFLDQLNNVGTDHREIIVEYLEKKAKLDQVLSLNNNHLYQFGI
jgi:hypothetical protein